MKQMKYKMNVMSELKKKGYTTYTLRKAGFSQSAYTKILHNEPVGSITLLRLCELLDCSVSDIIEIV